MISIIFLRIVFGKFCLRSHGAPKKDSAMDPDLPVRIEVVVELNPGKEGCYSYFQPVCGNDPKKIPGIHLGLFALNLINEGL